MDVQKASKKESERRKPDLFHRIITLEEGFKKKLDLLFSDTFLKRVNEDEKLRDTLKKTLMQSTTTWQDLVNRGAAIREHDTRDSLSKITQPTLIVHGSVDKFIPFKEAEFLDKQIPNSKLIKIEGYNHGSLLVEDAERINNLIWDFLQEHLE